MRKSSIPKGRAPRLIERSSNTFWMVDPAAGVCFTILTDVAPFGDTAVAEFHRKFEREVYRNM